MMLAVVVDVHHVYQFVFKLYIHVHTIHSIHVPIHDSVI